MSFTSDSVELFLTVVERGSFSAANACRCAWPMQG